MLPFPSQPSMMGISASETFRCIRRSRLSPCDFLNDYHRRIDVKQPDTQGFIQNKEPGLGNNPENNRFFPLRYSSRNHSAPPSSPSPSHTHTHGAPTGVWEEESLWKERFHLGAGGGGSARPTGTVKGKKKISVALGIGVLLRLRRPRALG